MRSSVVAKSRPAREGSGVSTAPPFVELMACMQAKSQPASNVSPASCVRTCITSPTRPALLVLIRESYLTSRGTPEPEAGIRRGG